MVEIIVKSKIKEYISSRDMNSSQDFFDALDIKVIKAISEAEKRAISNNRKTIKDVDLYFSEVITENNFCVKNKVKENVKNCNVSGSLYNSINIYITSIIDEAIIRTTGNNRKTVQARDL